VGVLVCNFPDDARVMVLFKENEETFFFNGPNKIRNLPTGRYYLEANSKKYGVARTDISISKSSQTLWEPFDLSSEAPKEAIAIASKEQYDQRYSPPPESILTEIPTTFMVPEVQKAQNYQLQISTRADFKSGIQYSSDKYKSNSMDVSMLKLNRGTKFYWRFRVKINNEWGIWS
jgi:hypothetical protein